MLLLTGYSLTPINIMLATITFITLQVKEPYVIINMILSTVCMI